MNQVIYAFQQLLNSLHIDDHSLLLICIGIIVGAVLLGGHRHVRYHYNRFRRYYGEYRRRYRDSW
jgi:hypothetical protein